MAVNSDLLQWWAARGFARLYVVADISNPTANPVVMFNQTVQLDTFVHRVTIGNGASVPMTYVLETRVAGGGAQDWQEYGRVTIEPGLTWHDDYSVDLAVGESIRLAILPDEDADGNSVALFEYVQPEVR